MKKMSLLVLALVVALPGCGNKQNGESSRPKKTSVQKYMDIDVDIDEDMDDEDLDGMDELTEEDIASFNFPEDEEEMMEEPEEIDFDEMMADLDENEDYSWIDAQSDDEFRKLYFSFNHYGVRDDQRAALHYDIEQVKQLIAEAGDAVVVIEGHACQEGAPAYNLALSERRAKTVADLFVASGIDRTAIKVVGRGQECPVTEGRTRQERNPNRRVEVRVIYT